MRARLTQWTEALGTSFWFVPALMIVAAVALSFVMIEIDRRTTDKVIETLGWIWSGGPDGARGLLSTIAGSMITVAGVVFSITIVSLSLASSQFGPRLIRNFIHDKGNQLVLGAFVATFVYCLLVLRTVRGTTGLEFVPHFAITVGLLLTLVNISVLIYFIHHVATMIQVEQVMGLVAQDLDEAIDYLFPKRLGQNEPEQQQRQDANADILENCASRAQVVTAKGDGYLQAIDTDRLMNLAKENDVIIALQHRPGDFVVRNGRLMNVWPVERVSEELRDKLADTAVLGSVRTPTQDVAFAIDQLVEIALRALSPGINDPFTAIACINRLGAALCRLAERTIPSPYRYDDENQLRVIADAVTFEGMTDAAFNQICQYGRSSVAVTIRLLEVIAIIAEQVQRDEDRGALRRQALMIKRRSENALSEEQDRQEVEQRYQLALQVLMGDTEAPHTPKLRALATNSHGVQETRS